jgi:hypothetical protein
LIFSLSFSSEFAVTVPPATRLPVEGLNVSLVDDTFKTDKSPVVVFAIPT